MLIFVLFVCLQEQQGIEYIYAPTDARTVHIYMQSHTRAHTHTHMHTHTHAHIQ